jgi:hypothetical protein
MTGLIGVIGNRPRATEFSDALDRLWKPKGWFISRQIGNSPARARNQLIRTAIEQELDYVLFLDDDHVFPPDTLLRLLNHGVDCVSALYTWRVNPFHANVFDQLSATPEGEPDPHGKLVIKPLMGVKPGLITCNIVGSGFFLAKVEVLKKVDDPWFTLGWPFQEEWCDDISFCVRLREAGVEIHVDTATCIDHIGTVLCRPFYFVNEEESCGEWRTAFVVDGTVVGVARHDYEAAKMPMDKLPTSKETHR